MTLAWSTLVVLLVLLPGFFFFFGLGLPDRFTRIAVDRSPLSHVAGALFASALVHLSLVLVWRTAGWPSPDLELLLRVMIGGEALKAPGGVGIGAAVPGPASPAAVRDTVHELALLLRSNSISILGYLLASCSLGAVYGAILGTAIVNQWPFFWRISQHRWLFKLRLHDGGARQTVASVMTSRHVSGVEKLPGANMILQGAINSFGVGVEGQIKYLVLQEPVQRFYLRYRPEAPVTTALESVRIGSTGSHRNHGYELDGPRLLYLPGEHIENVVFEQSERIDTAKSADWQVLDEAVKRKLASDSLLANATADVNRLLEGLDQSIPPHLAWRACVFRWEGGFLAISNSARFERWAPELRLRLTPGEGVAGNAVTLNSVQSVEKGAAMPELHAPNAALLEGRPQAFRIVAVPFGRHPKVAGRALAVLSLDLLEVHDERQAKAVQAALEHLAAELSTKYAHVFAPK